MFICEKGFSCCDFRYWDTTEDIDEDAKECGYLLEVATVKHGEWIDGEIHATYDGNAVYVSTCSNCKRKIREPLDFKFCPMCGAKMDSEVDDGRSD